MPLANPHLSDGNPTSCLTEYEYSNLEVLLFFLKITFKKKIMFETLYHPHFSNDWGAILFLMLPIVFFGQLCKVHKKAKIILGSSWTASQY